MVKGLEMKKAVGRCDSVCRYATWLIPCVKPQTEGTAWFSLDMFSRSWAVVSGGQQGSRHDAPLLSADPRAELWLRTPTGALRNPLWCRQLAQF